MLHVVAEARQINLSTLLHYLPLSTYSLHRPRALNHPPNRLLPLRAQRDTSRIYTSVPLYTSGSLHELRHASFFNPTLEVSRCRHTHNQDRRSPPGPPGGPAFVEPSRELRAMRLGYFMSGLPRGLLKAKNRPACRSHGAPRHCTCRNPQCEAQSRDRAWGDLTSDVPLPIPSHGVSNRLFRKPLFQAFDSFLRENQHIPFEDVIHICPLIVKAKEKIQSDE
jgi:hypothetical protein